MLSVAAIGVDDECMIVNVLNDAVSVGDGSSVVVSLDARWVDERWSRAAALEQILAVGGVIVLGL